MGEEREETTEPCMCGVGTILIVTFSPDHPWGGGSRYAAEFRCDDCARRYVIKGNGVVRKADHDRRHAVEQALGIARHDLMASAWARDLLRAAATYVDQKPSKAAIYRALSRVGLGSYSQAYFVKKWQSGDQWVSRLGCADLPRLLALLERAASAEAASALAAIDGLRAALPAEPVLRQLHP